MEAMITSAVLSSKSEGIRITTREKDGSKSEILLSANFCHHCKNDLAKEFEDFMKAKGYDIRSN